MKDPRKLNVELDDAAVRAITSISQTLLDQDRHTEAMEVLEYAQKHFQCGYPGAQLSKATHPKQARVLFHLLRQLFKVYLSRPGDDDSAHYLTMAEDLLKRLREEAGRIDKIELTWA
jgi:hypothetical protein